MVGRVNPSHQRPPWVPDSSVAACTRCRTSFSFELRRHHCRFCGNIFCHYCSSKSRPVLALGYADPVRVCDACHDLCALRDVFLDVVRTGDLRSTQAMLMHQDSPLLIRDENTWASHLEFGCFVGAICPAICAPGKHAADHNAVIAMPQIAESRYSRGH